MPMPKSRMLPATEDNVEHAKTALAHLKLARHHLMLAGAPQSIQRVRSAIKSTEGALRHIERRVMFGLHTALTESIAREKAKC